MSTSKYTPAPWVHHNYKTAVEITVAAADGKHIADVYAIASAANGDRHKAVTPTDKANARLIAASPEMFSTLKEIRKWMDEDFMGPWDAKFCAEIDALIAKVDGSNV